MRRVILVMGLVTWGTAALAAGSAWTKVSCSGVSFLLNAKGDLYTTGLRFGVANGDGRRAISPTFYSKWTRVLTRVTDISSATTHSAALRSNGTVWLTGTNEYGQLGQRRLRYAFSWKKSKLPTRAKVVGIGTGALTSYAVTTDGALWVVGRSELGTDASKTGALRFSSKWQTTLRDVVRIQAASNGVFAWRRDGSVSRIVYVLDTTSLIGQTFLPPAHWQPITLVADIVAARDGDSIQLLTRSGDLFTYGDDQNDGIPDDQQDGSGNLVATKPASDYLADSGLAAFEENTAFGFFSLTPTGQLQHWVPKQLLTPLTVIPAHWEPALDQVRSFCTGEKHALAIRSDGTVWAAGENASGQFGNGTTVGTASPKDWVQILQ